MSRFLHALSDRECATEGCGNLAKPTGKGRARFCTSCYQKRLRLFSLVADSDAYEVEEPPLAKLPAKIHSMQRELFPRLPGELVWVAKLADTRFR